MDVLTKEQRSYCMSLIRKTNTTPEIIVRKIIHKMGYRYRLYKKFFRDVQILFFLATERLSSYMDAGGIDIIVNLDVEYLKQDLIIGFQSFREIEKGTSEI